VIGMGIGEPPSDRTGPWLVDLGMLWHVQLGGGMSVGWTLTLTHPCNGSVVRVYRGPRLESVVAAAANSAPDGDIL